MQKVSIIGAGAWGTALALTAFRAGSKTLLWSIMPEEVETLNRDHENTLRLPGIPIDPQIRATGDVEEASDTDLMILCTPAQCMRETCSTFKPFVKPQVPLVITSKGIERETCSLMSSVVKDIFPDNPILILSGPSFAHDVAQNLPAAVVLASDLLEHYHTVAPLLMHSHFRLYGSTDMIGVQVGGACKNVIAIACGISEGLGLGDSATAALLTRGLAEMARLGVAMGGKQETFLGLAGVGDITLTALSHQSRNHGLGFTLGQGQSIQEIMAGKDNLTEGLYTVTATTLLAERYHVHMPLSQALYHLLWEGGAVQDLISQVLQRPLLLREE